MSDKDLDLYFLPMTLADTDGEPLKRWLDSMWGVGESLCGAGALTPDNAAYPQEPMYHSKLKYDYSGLRIDVFILHQQGDKDD